MFRVSDLPFPNCLEGVDSGAGLQVGILAEVNGCVLFCFAFLICKLVLIISYSVRQNCCEGY